MIYTNIYYFCIYVGVQCVVLRGLNPFAPRFRTPLYPIPSGRVMRSRPPTDPPSSCVWSHPGGRGGGPPQVVHVWLGAHRGWRCVMVKDRGRLLQRPSQDLFTKTRLSLADMLRETSLVEGPLSYKPRYESLCQSETLY